LRIWFHKVEQEIVMAQNRKETTVRKRRMGVETHRTIEKQEKPDTQVPAASKAPGIPPTDNLKKHPDEAYGDTEIPQRGKHLDSLKAGTN
jgi:hypothetical protein